MADMTHLDEVHRTPPSACINCGRVNNAMVAINAGNAKPAPGQKQLAVCMNCGTVMGVTDDGRLRAMTAEEELAVAGNPDLLAAQDARRLKEADMGGLPMWVVYYDTSDFPGEVVARLWQGLKATSLMIKLRSPVGVHHFAKDTQLEIVRRMIREKMPGAYRLAKMDHDDPKIVEIWL